MVASKRIRIPGGRGHWMLYKLECGHWEIKVIDGRARKRVRCGECMQLGW